MSINRHRVNQLFLSQIDSNESSINPKALVQKVLSYHYQEIRRDTDMSRELITEALYQRAREFLKNYADSESNAINTQYLEGFDLNPKEAELIRMIGYKRVHVTSQEGFIEVIPADSESLIEAACELEKHGTACLERARALRLLAKIRQGDSVASHAGI